MVGPIAQLDHARVPMGRGNGYDMREFRLFRWFKQLLGASEPVRQAGPVVADRVVANPAAPVQPPLSESLAELNAAMHTLDGEMLRLAQAWQSLGSSLESLKQQKKQPDSEVVVFGRIDSTRLN